MKYQFPKGYKPWNKGKTLITEPRLEKCRYWLGKKNLNGFKKGHTPWNKGIPCREETKRKLRKAKKGYPSPFKGKQHTKEAKKIIGEKGRGRIAWNKGTKGLMKSNSGTFKKGQFEGKKHWGWKGGISKLPYAYTFTKKLKKQVKERDNFTCFLCEETKDLVIHHIDFNKMNCDLKNLITLCRKCNSIVNFKRNYWKEVILCGIKKMG